MKFTIYTDGSCLKNPGAGGYAAVIIDEETGHMQQIADGEKMTTNNRMEISAVIKALELTPVHSEIDLYTDSQYLKNTFTEHWLENWKSRNWLTASGKPAKNIDLWKILDVLVKDRKVTFNWTKGHAGNFYNELCDSLARAQANKFQRS